MTKCPDPQTLHPIRHKIAHSPSREEFPSLNPEKRPLSRRPALCFYSGDLNAFQSAFFPVHSALFASAAAPIAALSAQLDILRGRASDENRKNRTFHTRQPSLQTPLPGVPPIVHNFSRKSLDPAILN